MAEFIVLLLLLVLVSFLLGRSIARHTELARPFRASVRAVLIGVSVESLLAWVYFAPLSWAEHGAVRAMGNVAFALQVPGLLFSMTFGFGPQSVGEKVILLFPLTVAANAVIYSFTFFAIGAFIHRTNRVKIDNE